MPHQGDGPSADPVEKHDPAKDRGGSACLDSAPLVLSGFLPGLSNAGPGDFVAAEGEAMGSAEAEASSALGQP